MFYMVYRCWLDVHTWVCLFDNFFSCAMMNFTYTYLFYLCSIPVHIIIHSQLTRSNFVERVQMLESEENQKFPIRDCNRFRQAWHCHPNTTRHQNAAHPNLGFDKGLSRNSASAFAAPRMPYAVVRSK